MPRMRHLILACSAAVFASHLALATRLENHGAKDVVYFREVSMRPLPAR